MAAEIRVRRFLCASFNRQPPKDKELKMTIKESLGFTVLSLLMACLLLGLQAGCKTDQPIAAELQSLQGTWEGVALSQETPGGPFVKSAGTITITITGNSFHFHRDTNFWFETTITLPAGTAPQQLHATIKDNAPSQGSNAIGKVVVALFKIEEGILTLAARGDGSEETPISFEDENVTRYELRKVQHQKKNTQPPRTK
ncbi:MAG: hypothetical protein ALAOOOJD_04827 [bacterium]|nr:hypothetical protein [bacterium]